MAIDMTKIQKELEQVRTEHAKRLLNPEDVIKFARNPKTALHAKFTWDNTAAAHEHRLWEARHVIRCQITVTPGYDEPIHVYVSMHGDRGDTGGYRPTVEVISDAGRYRQLLVEALADLQVLRRKYKHLQELKAVFAAIDSVPKPKPKRMPKPKSKPKRKAKSKPRRRKAG